MKHLLLFVVFVLMFCCAPATNCKAQDKLELGALLGVGYYMGDLNPSQQFKSPRPAIGGIARYAFSDRLAAKLNVVALQIAGEYPGSGDKYPEWLWTSQQNGNATTSNTYSFDRMLVDIGLTGEFNFMSYDHMFKKKESRFTPYLTVGVAATGYKRYKGNDSGETVFVLSLPFGFGVKYKANKWLRIGAEWTLRKTFVDDLDYVTQDGSIDPSDVYGFGTTSKTHNNDWYSIAGVTVTLSMWPRTLECNDGTRSFNR